MKKFAAMLAALTIMCVVFLACSQGGDSPDNSVTEANLGNAEDFGADKSEQQQEKLQPDLPELDLNGETITFLVRSEQFNWYWCSHEIYAEEETGEPLNDAVYKRNRTVEARYNFEIKEYRSSNPSGDANRSAKAGDEAYDAFMLGPNETATMAQNGYLMNLYDVPYIDLEKPWWDQRAVSQLGIGGRLYCALGDINTQDNDALFVIFFNKKLIADHNMQNPYQFAKSGEWTLDKFNEMCKDISKDLNGDGTMDESDLYGQLTEYLGAYMFFVGGGGRITASNPQNYPELVINDPKSPALVDKILVNMGDRNLTLMANDYSGKYNNPWDDLTRPMFKNDQA
ncbi:MAG: extracellular solute-binding protein, partial [Oscillospiraceae bacterium]|nr:extracellular solute-binding protein [Oscillospiraceae bacterium]